MPESDRLYRCWSKAIRGEEGPPRRSMKWVGARRPWFEIYADRVVCGDWTIPLAQVTEAVAYRTKQVTVLQLKTSEHSYQFGLNPWASPLKHLSIPIREEKVPLGLSLGSLAVRLLLLAVIIYYVVKMF